MRPPAWPGICHQRKRRRGSPRRPPTRTWSSAGSSPTRPDRLWSTDITEHRAGDGKVYCCAVLDAYSRRIVGWSIADHIRSELVVDALQMARWHRRPAARHDRARRPRQRNTPPGSSGTGCARPACSARWAGSRPASTTP